MDTTKGFLWATIKIIKMDNNQADFLLHQSGASMGVMGEISYKPQLIRINSLKRKQVQCPDNNRSSPALFCSTCYVLLNSTVNC